jgi:predicted RNA-binding protein with PIN domain
VEPVAAPTVLVDARNVIRSAWPNVPDRALVARCREWAEAVGVRAVLVFDGRAPAHEDDDRVAVVGTGRESADDWIVRAANELARVDRPYRLVTSDRALRAAAGRRADDVVGGGTFLRTLGAVTSGPSAPSSRAEHAPRA